jgi:hypothetical protein
MKAVERALMAVPAKRDADHVKLLLDVVGI